MNYIIFSAEYEKAKNILRDCGLLKSCLMKNGEYSQGFKKACKEKPFCEAYDVAINSLDYDFLFADDSFIQLEFREDASANKVFLRYAYYQNPFQHFSYKDFLSFYGFSIDETGEMLREDYDQAMLESEPKEDCFLIRYDCSFKEYEEGIHPYSHLHIGYKESISIPINKILTPFVFIFFILKNCYPQVWSEQMNSNTDFKDLYYAQKSALKSVHADAWKELDKLELFLG